MGFDMRDESEEPEGGIGKRFRFTLTRDHPDVGGILAGVVGAGLSLGLRQLFPGRLPGDPVPLVVLPNQILNGLGSRFLYFDGRAPLVHLLFAAALGLLAVGSLRWLQKELPKRGRAARAGRTAALVSLGITALFEVDSIVVAFYFGIGALLSLAITTYVAGWAAANWARWSSRPEGG